MDIDCCECVFEEYDQGTRPPFRFAVTFVSGDALCFNHAGQRLTQRRTQSATGQEN